MHRHGGMYADLDMEALRDLGPILGKETRPVFSAMQVPLPSTCACREPVCSVMVCIGEFRSEGHIGVGPGLR